ncbi:MAG: Holliday junction resolvase RuvX [Candidatus Krumholzibacteria bacterium]|nr:Holliday junction resolvase RuvX [Candidatus Krumholzibacteria bacterium]
MSSENDRKSRIMGIDPGTKRTGLAMSDPLGMTAQGLATFDSGTEDALVEHVRALAVEYGVSLVVIGLPLSMSGGEIEGTARSRALAGKIRERCGVEVVLRDERMTSLEVERVMKQAGRIRKAGDIDKLAAVLLLQSYLDEKDS